MSSDSDKTLIYLLTLGIAAIFLIPELKKRLFPTTAAQTGQIFSNLGATTYPSTLTPKAEMVQYTDIMGTTTTYKFNQGDYDKLNLAQKILLNTKIVPVRWILG